MFNRQTTPTVLSQTKADGKAEGISAREAYARRRKAIGDVVTMRFILQCCAEIAKDKPTWSPSDVAALLATLRMFVLDNGGSLINAQEDDSQTQDGAAAKKLPLPA